MDTATLSQNQSATKLPPKPFTRRLLAADIADMVPMPELLRELGFTPNERTRRGPCRLHGGSNPTAFAWEEDGRWHCFNCGKGGDKFTLVEEVRSCNFPEALKFLAALAGVEITEGAPPPEEIEKHRRERQRVEAGSAKLAEIERRLRLGYREELHDLHEIRRNAGERLKALANGEPCRWEGEGKFLGGALSFVANHLPNTSVSHQILAFGETELRMRFALNPDTRQVMIDEVLLAGHIVDDDGKWVDVAYE